MAGKKSRTRINERYQESFSANFDTYVSPYMKNKGTVQNIKKSWDDDYVRSLSKEQVKELVLDLTSEANRRISNYLKSSYYTYTKQYPNASKSDAKLRPTPAAFQALAEREGKIKRFSKKDLDDMTLGQLKKRLASVRQFVSAESSMIGSKTHGFRRIMNERFELFTKGLKETLGSRYKKQFSDNVIKSEAFSQMFWHIFNRFMEKNPAYKYEKRKQVYGEQITREVTEDTMTWARLGEIITSEIYKKTKEYSRLGKRGRERLEEDLVFIIDNIINEKEITKSRKESEQDAGDITTFQRGYTSHRGK